MRYDCHSKPLDSKSASALLCRLQRNNVDRRATIERVASNRFVVRADATWEQSVTHRLTIVTL